MIPDHIVLQEILPRAYSGLSIDTRRSFGLPPRRIVVSTSTRVALERYVQTRMDDEYDSEDDEDDPPLTISSFTGIAVQVREGKGNQYSHWSETVY